MSVPHRLDGCDPVLDPALTRGELEALVGLVLEGEASDEVEEWALTFLEANLPGAEVKLLIEWPGEWFRNRWFEEVAFTPPEVVDHALERCGRVLGG
jgi:hypothetical protein